MFLESEKNAGLLRYELFPGEPVDEFTVGALRQNAPAGVLIPGRETTDEYDHLLFPVAGLVSPGAPQVILKDSVDICKLLKDIWAIHASLPSYMIPTEELVLRPEWTFLDPETHAPKLLVLPTPAARDLSLSRDHYEALIRLALEKTGREEESAKPSARPVRPARPWRAVLRDFWENLD